MKRRRLGILAAAAMAALSAAAFAEEAYVSQATVVVREGKGAAYGEVARLKKGDKVEIMAREEAWLKVKVNGREGYLFAKSVGDKSGGGNADLSKFFGAASGSDATSSGEAGKGLGEALEWAKGQHLSDAGLNRMKQQSKPDGKAWEQFAKDGQVGPYKAK